MAAHGEKEGFEANPLERPFDTLVNYRRAVDPGNSIFDAFLFIEIMTYDPMEVCDVLLA